MRRAWVRGVVAGVVFGIALAALLPWVLPGDGWWVGVVTGAVAGVFFGAVMGPAAARLERRLWRVAGEDLTWQQFREASRASRSGRVPADPRVHNGAVRLAVYQLAQHRRQRTPLVVIFGLGAALNLFSGVTDGDWFNLAAAVYFVAAIVVVLLQPQRLGRALIRLRGEDNQPET
ncbi:putative membrane protein [Amycolatopsis bartoniae]|uniref:Uncharacterized protein n=1 Tax=Amycolatopsis bartoniae TaxID=941986 RepID=A0A8H9J3C0_9PSEU|nr:hypothetical protein [Amycolatopsis bartoniae]MBB2936494.1 putative membrane protein [Amycolatopsis bartoniae]TVT11026.1 hypothetical protein FNH07_03265 [Amycolatopsis bartoniae]GHF68545.1 hypothetical protein GCM10017566_47960 [Amycolatopsis bartoniae]